MYILLACSALMLALGLVYVSKRLTHPKVVINHTSYPICGIDVSNHNGEIDFEKVAKDTISFVIIKASEGVTYKDPRFNTNYRNARGAGLKVGAYHFFRKKKDGKLQADNFMRAVRGKAMDLPYVIDVEDWGDDLLVPEKEAIANLQNMITRLEQYGVKIMIYTNKDGHKKYIKANFSHLHLWLCTFTEPTKITAYNWHIQQYSHWGQVAGIEGDVDLNIFNGTQAQWEAWLNE